MTDALHLVLLHNINMNMQQSDESDSLKSISLLSIDSSDIDDNENNNYRFNKILSSTFNDSNTVLFSHDSTHVRRVQEAERQTNLARERAATILRKMSVEVEEHDKQTATILSKLSMEVAYHSRDTIKNEGGSPEDSRDEGYDKNCPEVNFDSFRIPMDIDDASYPSEDHSNNDVKVFEQIDAPTENDIEHLKQCILPLSPSGVPKGHRKRLSGQFEFKRMNSVLTVVRSFDDDSKHSYGSTADSKSKSRLSRFPFGRKNASKSNRSKGSGKSQSSSTLSESNALTDDARLLQEVCETEKNVGNKKEKKEKKTGDLPPRAKRRSAVGSMKAAASDAEREDVISVLSNLSDLSLESISHKVKNSAPLVVTDADMASRQEVRIPDILCLKIQVKLSPITKITRKLSFNRSSKASF